MQLIDIGVNLTHPALQKHFADVINNAKNAGIMHQIITGTSLESSKQALHLTQSYPGYLTSTVGCHPHDAKDFQPSDLQLIEDISKQQAVVAIGECGLDFNRNYSPQDIQQQVFESQIEIACKVQLPLFMHQRDAHQTFIEMLSHYKGQYTGGVIHCFTGNKQQMKDCLDLGLNIGITGWLCDERRGVDLAKAIKYLPLDRMMVETDAPFLLPRNIRPKPKSRINAPAYLPWIISKISEITKLTPEFIAEATTNNVKRLFTITKLE